MKEINTAQQKVLELIYSGTVPNDLLALEIIKNGMDDTLFFAPLVSILLTSNDPESALIIYDFLEAKLTTQQQNLISRYIEKGQYTQIYPLSIKDHFSNSVCTEIAYTAFRRNGRSAEAFLVFDSGDHPERALIFNHLLENFYINGYDLKIPGLLPHEMELLVQRYAADLNNHRIRSLVLESLKSPELPELILNKNFEQVVVHAHFAPSFFPDFIFRFKGLKKLTLVIKEDTNIPDDWSALSELTDLRLGGEGHVFEQFDFIDQLPKLKMLNIGGHYISHPSVLLRKKIVPLQNYQQFCNTKGYVLNDRNQIFILPQHQALGIASALGKSILSREEQNTYFQKIVQLPKIQKLEALPLDDLMALMNVNNSALRTVVQGQIDRLSEKQNGIVSLNEKSLLYIAGTPGRKKTEIKQKLKALNIPFINKPSEAITHLLIGKGPKEYRALQNKEYALVSEQALYQLFKTNAPDFLEEAEQAGDTMLSTNVRQLLFHDETANIKIGLEMLKTGGVPEDLIDPLLVVYKTCPDTKTRGMAKKILDRHAPADYLPIINDSQRFTNLHNKVRAQEINKKLEKLARTTSRKLAAKLSLLLHNRFKKGLRYVLYHFHEPCEERTLALQAMMEGTHLDFAAGLGFTSWKDKDPDSIMLYKMKSIAKFPADIVAHVPLIETANFHNCKFSSLPKNVGDLKDLKTLDLSHNFLGSIPKSIEAMTQLEHLDLQMNTFKTFPTALKKLSNLKTLDLRYNQVNGVPSPLVIEDDVRGALKDCEIFI